MFCKCSFGDSQCLLEIGQQPSNHYKDRQTDLLSRQVTKPVTSLAEPSGDESHSEAFAQQLTFERVKPRCLKVNLAAPIKNKQRCLPLCYTVSLHVTSRFWDRCCSGDKKHISCSLIKCKEFGPTRVTAEALKCLRAVLGSTTKHTRSAPDTLPPKTEAAFVRCCACAHNLIHSEEYNHLTPLRGGGVRRAATLPRGTF